VAAMDVSMEPLATFLSRAQIALRNERAGVDVDRWRGAALDISLLKALHTAVVGDRKHVRRVLVDGSSIVATAQPGHVRTKPQAFRVGDHMIPAWEQGRLKSGLVELCRDVTPLLARDPVRAAAWLVWSLARAQPFTGMNERLALTIASWVMRSADLPALDVEKIERDTAFTDALLAEDRRLLERYLTDAMWDEVSRLVEGHAPGPSIATQRWTLADEHAAASTSRERATKLDPRELAAFVDNVVAWIERELPSRFDVPLANNRRAALATHADRLACAWKSAARGRLISPHDPIAVVRWAVASAATLGLELVLVVGTAGRGTSGAALAHIALEVAEQPMTGTAPAMLLIPDESRDQREVRTVAWLERVLPRALEQSAMRI
jgi:hypothetical protein